MARVPREIRREERLGRFTAKQLAYLWGFAALAALLFLNASFLPVKVRVAVSLLSFFPGPVLAFVSFEGRGLDEWARSALRFYLKGEEGRRRVIRALEEAGPGPARLLERVLRRFAPFLLRREAPSALGGAAFKVVLPVSERERLLQIIRTYHPHLYSERLERAGTAELLDAIEAANLGGEA